MPEPNLPPLVVSLDEVEEVKAGMPELLDDIQARFMATCAKDVGGVDKPCYGLSEYDASVLVGEPGAPEFFEAVRAERERELELERGTCFWSVDVDVAEL